jgi:pSer/pThr/pTyr-binding forkhead associated (FHA) protein
MMTSLLSACGVADSVQLSVKHQTAHEAEVRLLRQPFAVIGRSPRADIVLDHPQVSARHVYLQVVDGWAFWIDLGSRTGTRTENNPQKFGWLEGQRRLCIGPYVFQRYVSDSQNNIASARSKPPQDTPLVALAYGHALLPHVSLEFLNGPSQSMSWPMHRVMSLLGSARGCKFRLADPSVSRFHASLLRTSAGLWVIDLLGQNGVTVNEKPVRFTCLDDGDLLGIGRYRIRVRCRSDKDGSRTRFGAAAFANLQRWNPRSNGTSFPDWVVAALAADRGSGAAEDAQFPVLVENTSSLPNLESVSAAAAFPAKSAQSELIRCVLVPLVNQFGLVQQQMFDQFQQAMAVMVQMVGTMHRNQMEAVRAELEQLRELTQEFHALKTELASRTRGQSEMVSSDGTSPLSHVEVSATAEDGVSTAAFAAKASAPNVPVEARGNPFHGLGTARVAPVLPVSSPASAGYDRFAESSRCESSERPSSNPLAAPSADQEYLAPVSRSGTSSAGASLEEADSDRNTIAWLHQRIRTIECERASRWQKILRLLPGVS